jgi:RHS repeat-associated protein
MVNRLTSEKWYDAAMTPLYAFQWDYDPVGNRTYEKRGNVETYYTYHEANELLRTHRTSDDAWTYFQYDPRGDTTAIQESDGTMYFSYNPVNLVTAIAYKSGVANYFYYDARMRRYAIEESAGLRYFTWDRNGTNLLCERDAGGNLTAEYAHGYTPIDGIGSMTAARKPVGATTYYQYPIYDNRGTVMRLVDGAGQITATYEYDAWGNGLHVGESPPTNKFQYQANCLRLLDSEGRFYLSPARVYLPPTARWAQRDWIWPRNSVHLYSAFVANPLCYVDPTGYIIRKPVDSYVSFFTSDEAHLYTCNCGWLDKNHLTAMFQHVNTVYLALRAGETSGVVRNIGRAGGQKFWYRYDWKLITGPLTERDLQIGSAERIANAGLLYFELAQMSSQYMRWARTPFSLEDPPSNYLGARLAGEYMRSLDDPASATEGGFWKYVRSNLERACGVATEGETTWALFEARGWDTQLVYDGRKPVLIPKSDPEDCCPPNSALADIFGRPWQAVGFSATWSAEWYWIELPSWLSWL